MYQTIVLGLGFLIFFGSAYLIEHMDQQGVIMSVLKGGSVSGGMDDLASSTLSSVTGVYLCDTDSGCKNPVTLTVANGGDLSMSTTFNDGVETLDEAGKWKYVKDGRIALYITGSTVETYPRPKVISVKYVSPIAFAGLTYSTNLYKDWVRPVFKKQDNSETQDTTAQ